MYSKLYDSIIFIMTKIKTAYHKPWMKEQAKQEVTECENVNLTILLVNNEKVWGNLVCSAQT